jgi:hypothetical protein
MYDAAFGLSTVNPAPSPLFLPGGSGRREDEEEE